MFNGYTYIHLLTTFRNINRSYFQYNLQNTWAINQYHAITGIRTHGHTYSRAYALTPIRTRSHIQKKHT